MDCTNTRVTSKSYLQEKPPHTGTNTPPLGPHSLFLEKRWAFSLSTWTREARQETHVILFYPACLVFKKHGVLGKRRTTTAGSLNFKDCIIQAALFVGKKTGAKPQQRKLTRVRCFHRLAAVGIVQSKLPVFSHSSQTMGSCDILTYIIAGGTFNPFCLFHFLLLDVMETLACLTPVASPRASLHFS